MILLSELCSSIFFMMNDVGLPGCSEGCANKCDESRNQPIPRYNISPIIAGALTFPLLSQKILNANEHHPSCISRYRDHTTVLCPRCQSSRRDRRANEKPHEPSLRRHHESQ